MRRDPQERLAEWEYAEDGSWVRVMREWPAREGERST